MDHLSISLTTLSQASEIRNKAIANKQTGYIPTVIEIALALEEMQSQNNQTADSSNNPKVNSVIQWVQQWFPQSKHADDNTAEVPTDNSVTASQVTSLKSVYQNTVDKHSGENYTAGKSDDKMQNIYNQLQQLNINGAKIELVQKPQHGI